MPENSSNQDYRDLINERFNSVNSSLTTHFEVIGNQLTSLTEQVQKTNGKIIKAESDIKDLQISDAKHNAGFCPNGAYFTNKFEKIETAIADFKKTNTEDLQDYHFFKRNPKLVIAGICVAVFLMFISFTGYEGLKASNEVGRQNVELNQKILENQKTIQALQLQIDKNNPKR